MYNNDFPHHFPKNFSGEELPQPTSMKADGMREEEALQSQISLQEEVWIRNVD